MAMGIRKKDTVWNTVCHVPVYHLQDPACLPRDSCGLGVVITVLHTSKLTTNGGVPPTKFPLTTGPLGSKNFLREISTSRHIVVALSLDGPILSGYATLRNTG